MAERPILFSGEMVRAILDGRKTQTRRVVRPQFAGTPHRYSDYWRCGDQVARCPYGHPGDLLWVRETWRPFRTTHQYRASWVDGDSGDGHWWRPSIHMPKRIVRIWLRVTDVRVERVQDITEADAMAEGAEPAAVCCGAPWRDEYGEVMCCGCPEPDYRLGFEALWDAINARRGFGWDVNPWVWAIGFEVVSTTGRPEVDDV